jgi:hypothetical protein
MSDAFTLATATPERRPGDFKRDAKGTPMVASADGALVKSGDRKGQPKWDRYARPSGFSKIIEDAYNLQKWAERQIGLGLAVALNDQDADLISRVVALHPADQEADEWRSEADSIIAEAKRLAKAGLAAERGTHAHTLTEHNDTERDWVAMAEAGEELGLPIEAQAALVEAWNRLVTDYGFEVLATELAVVHDGYRCAGTLDRIVRLTRPLVFSMSDGRPVTLTTGTVLVVDVKTGKLRHRNGDVSYWNGYPVQIAIYAGSTGYDPATDTRYDLPYEVDQNWAIIAHLDVLAALQGEAVGSLILVDLELGRRGADLAQAAKEYERVTPFSLADTHVVRVPVASPLALASAEVSALQDTADDTRDNLLRRCRKVAELSPQGAEWLKAELVKRDLNVKSATPAEFPLILEVLEQAETYVSAPFDPLPVPPVAAVVSDRVAVPSLDATPDEGPLVFTDEDDTFAEMRAAYGALDDAGRSWVSQIVTESIQAGRSLHMVDARTLRRVRVALGLALLAADGTEDEGAVRALVHLATGVDAALFPSVPLGAAVSVMSADEAEVFVSSVRLFLDGLLAASVDDDGHVRLGVAA